MYSTFELKYEKEIENKMWRLDFSSTILQLLCIGYNQECLTFYEYIMRILGYDQLYVSIKATLVFIGSLIFCQPIDISVLYFVFDIRHYSCACLHWLYNFIFVLWLDFIDLSQSKTRPRVDQQKQKCNKHRPCNAP